MGRYVAKNKTFPIATAARSRFAGDGDGIVDHGDPQADQRIEAVVNDATGETFIDADSPFQPEIQSEENPFG
jgi:hypothetical protein